MKWNGWGGRPSLNLPCRTSSRQAGSTASSGPQLLISSPIPIPILILILLQIDWVACHDCLRFLLVLLVFELPDTLLALNIFDRHFADINSSASLWLLMLMQLAQLRSVLFWSGLVWSLLSFWWRGKPLRVALSSSCQQKCRSARNLIYAMYKNIQHVARWWKCGSQPAIFFNKKMNQTKKWRPKASGKTIEQRQQRRMFYDSHCHLCKLGVRQWLSRSCCRSSKGRGATKADRWPLLSSGANFPPDRKTSRLPRGLNFLCHGLEDPASQAPKTPIQRSLQLRWLWATCFMISGGDLLSFDLKSSGQDTHQYMWLVKVSWRHGVIYSFGRDLRRAVGTGHFDGIGACVGVPSQVASSSGFLRYHNMVLAAFHAYYRNVRFYERAQHG